LITWNSIIPTISEGLFDEIVPIEYHDLLGYCLKKLIIRGK